MVIVENQGYWNFLYRPALVHTGETVSCLYGIVNQENQWYISMSTGDNVHQLNGITNDQKKDMLPLTDNVIDTHSIRYQIKLIYHAIHVHFRPELLLLAAFEAVLLLTLKTLHKKKRILAIFKLANILFSFIYIIHRLHPVAYVSWFGVIIAICCLNICMSAILSCICIPSIKEQ